MKKSRFTGSQIVAVFNQAEGVGPVPAPCREHGNLCFSPEDLWRKA